jgi:hypothetical protein
MLLRARVEKKLREFKPLLGLQGWEHNIVFHETQPQEDDEKSYEEQTALSVECFPNYLRFKLNVYPKFERRIKEREYNCDLYLLHELSHVILSAYDKLLDEYLGNNDTHLHTMISEQTTEAIARAVLRGMNKYDKLDF